MAQTSEQKTQATPSWWLWVVIGAALGVFLRVLFGELPPNLRGPMSLAFLVGTPFVAGALTAYGARASNPGIAFLLFAPWITVLLMFLGCAVALLEGSICLALLTPLFLVCASLGGVTMGIALRFVTRAQSRLTAVVFLPLLMMVGEGHVPLGDQTLELRRTVLVNAVPSTIWKEILAARSIRSEELPFSLTHFIGVPKPLEGINVQTGNGEVRFSKWERGVNFRAVVTARRENESMTWRYVFDEQSFPDGSMDEHVAIGGRYFDLRDTTFNLHPTSEGQTRLEIVAHYRVTTSINLYAIPATTILGRDFLDTILALYKNRSEAAQRSGDRILTSAKLVTQSLPADANAFRHLRDCACGRATWWSVGTNEG
jgi:hypothetical protein